MKLLNFSTGRIQTIQIGDEAIQTAHLKVPVDEPWLITEDGAQGDSRAVHPDKIYAFARAAYQYWGEFLAIDSERWPDGFFGENLTLDILDEEDIRVGDVFTLGDDVRLVVTGARTPCVKLAWRLNQPRTFQKAFAKSRHAGMYLGVLHAGQVRPGDVLQRIHHDAAMPSVADVCDFVADHKPPPLAPLKRLLACEHLSPANRLLLGAKLEAAERAEVIVAGGWHGWRPFRINAVIEETPHIRSFYLEATDSKALCQPRPGQHVSVQIQNNQKITRAWSLSEYSEAVQRYRLTIRQQSGPGSRWMHRAKEGAVVKLRSPAGNFVLDMGSFRPLVLVAAGIGITPIMAMLQAHLSRTNAPPVYLIYGAKTPADVVFTSALEHLVRQHPQLHVATVYSQSDAGKRPAGRITLQVLKAELTDLHVVLENNHRVDLPWYEGDIYICGPGSFCQDLKADIVTHGGNPDHVFIETFTAMATQTTDVDSAEVRFAKSGITSMWDADREQTLLELAEESGIAIANDCRAGACLTCKVPLREGETTAETGEGSTLLCIARPKTRILVLDC